MSAGVIGQAVPLVRQLFSEHVTDRRDSCLHLTGGLEGEPNAHRAALRKILELKAPQKSFRVPLEVRLAACHKHEPQNRHLPIQVALATTPLCSRT